MFYCSSYKLLAMITAIFLRFSLTWAIICFVTICSFSQNIPVFHITMGSRASSQYYEEEFKRIGNYKVKGNSYLLKGANVSDLFTTLGYGVNMPLVFDTYTQDVSVMKEDKKNIVTLSFEELDSFVVKVDMDKSFSQPATFVNAGKIEPGKKMYLERLATGAKFGLYKSYQAQMQRAAMDIAQTNLMEFEITSEYFYLPAGGTEFIKIKQNLSTLKKQFSSETQGLKLLANTSKENLESNLVYFFDFLNSKN